MPSNPLQRRRAQSLGAALLAWYQEEARDLPWRHSRDPYAIWVSEVMLQQTRVETVRGRWERFLARFPDLASLAAAPLSEVLAEWAGLGYYRRARQLHAAARAVVEKEGGRLPGTFAALRLLPGFGAYTAGAVASIAYGEVVPAVDGNVERVLSRLLGLEEDPRRGEGARTLREAAFQLAAQGPPGEINQGLMELGAVVCKPAAPDCGACPWSRSCTARRTGLPEAFPRRAPRPETLTVAAYSAVLRRQARLLWRRRPEEGLNAGLWELPTTEWHGGDPRPEEATRRLGEMAREAGARWEVGEALVRVRHGITRHRVIFSAHEVAGEAPRGEVWRWGTPEEAMGWGITAAARKLARRLPPLL